MCRDKYHQYHLAGMLEKYRACRDDEAQTEHDISMDSRKAP